ncbi:ATP-dependent Clp protease adapter ClpS [Synechococcus sp. PCC 7336]|uniref:ATP-dependent Clp protease adapter ClpS n=1 Tax=Synechococcus sp. PCC 7336 TaxID=195250 RepID=UPI000477C453|nr:ATP-dependent Clp protease adapter ClpS [Synechococcus sp. PCC 7336]
MVFAEVKPKSSTDRKPMPMYRVLLHNDDYTPMEYVIEVLVQTIPAMQPPQAREIMLEAHTNGSAVVIVVPKEHAEFYKEQLQNHGLISTIEPDC